VLDYARHPVSERALHLGKASGTIVRILQLGADPTDSAERRSQKQLLVGIALMVLPAGLLWGSLYWVFGEPIAALFPWCYVVASALCLATFARTRNFGFLRFSQLALILVTPAMLIVALGGLQPSGGVILWSLLAPLGAVVFDRPDRAWAWFATIQITRSTWELVRDDFVTEPRGPVDVKGKGRVETWHLVGPRADLEASRADARTAAGDV
jgi:hypothetical protein